LDTNFFIVTMFIGSPSFKYTILGVRRLLPIHDSQSWWCFNTQCLILSIGWQPISKDKPVPGELVTQIVIQANSCYKFVEIMWFNCKSICHSPGLLWFTERCIRIYGDKTFCPESFRCFPLLFMHTYGILNLYVYLLCLLCLNFYYTFAGQWAISCWCWVANGLLVFV